MAQSGASSHACVTCPSLKELLMFGVTCIYEYLAGARFAWKQGAQCTPLTVTHCDNLIPHPNSTNNEAIACMYLSCRALSKALLHADYGVTWSLPPGQLIPPVPNRANYIHWLEDLLRLSPPPGETLPTWKFA